MTWTVTITNQPGVRYVCLTEAQMRLISMTLDHRGHPHKVVQARTPLALVKGGPGR